MLYHVPDNIAKQRSELDTKKREYYNKQVNIPPTNAYPPVDTDEKGQNLNITSEK